MLRRLKPTTLFQSSKELKKIKINLSLYLLSDQIIKSLLTMLKSFQEPTRFFLDLDIILLSPNWLRLRFNGSNGLRTMKNTKFRAAVLQGSGVETFSPVLRASHTNASGLPDALDGLIHNVIQAMTPERWLKCRLLIKRRRNGSGNRIQNQKTAIENVQKGKAPFKKMNLEADWTKRLFVTFKRGPIRFWCEGATLDGCHHLVASSNNNQILAKARRLVKAKTSFPPRKGLP